jgi:hypothetical protein
MRKVPVLSAACSFFSSATDFFRAYRSLSACVRVVSSDFLASST